MERKSSLTKTAYYDERAEIAGELIERLIKLADKYYIDRDKCINDFVDIFIIITEVSTFSEYEVKNEK